MAPASKFTLPELISELLKAGITSPNLRVVVLLPKFSTAVCSTRDACQVAPVAPLRPPQCRRHLDGERGYGAVRHCIQIAGPAVEGGDHTRDGVGIRRQEISDSCRLGA